MVAKFKQAMADSAAHAEQFEGVQEDGLRMLVFGKPGSGKVSYMHSGWRGVALTGRARYQRGTLTHGPAVLLNLTPDSWSNTIYPSCPLAMCCGRRSWRRAR